MNKLIYVAAPFSDKDKSIEIKRYIYTQRYCMEELQKGYNAISPVVHWYYPAIWIGLNGDFAQFKNFCLALLDRCDSMTVLMLDGWRDSVGVRAEIERATQIKIPVTYLTPYWME